MKKIVFIVCLFLCSYATLIFANCNSTVISCIADGIQKEFTKGNCYSWSDVSCKKCHNWSAWTICLNWARSSGFKCGILSVYIDHQLQEDTQLGCCGADNCSY